MNERIKELKEQTMEWVPNQIDPDTKIRLLNAEKFAELIVRECIVIVDKWSYDGPYREEGDIIPVKKIKEHFGVDNKSSIVYTYGLLT
jgi:hypothetical protein